MKTIKDYLNELQEPYRTQALNNLDKGYEDRKVKNILIALTLAFVWDESPEKHKYWNDLYKNLDPKS